MRLNELCDAMERTLEADPCVCNLPMPVEIAEIVVEIAVEIADSVVDSVEVAVEVTEMDSAVDVAAAAVDSAAEIVALVVAAAVVVSVVVVDADADTSQAEHVEAEPVGPYAHYALRNEAVFNTHPL